MLIKRIKATLKKNDNKFNNEFMQRVTIILCSQIFKFFNDERNEKINVNEKSQQKDEEL